MPVSGPEHYRRAAHAADQATRELTPPAGGATDPALAAAWAALAQAHATLASTAAALARHLGLPYTAEEAWREATGLTRTGQRPVIEGTTEPPGGTGPA
jgi:hypothetical protein